MLRNFLSSIAVGLALTVGGLGVTGAQAERVLKLNESTGIGSPEEISLREFKRLVEERSGGELKIQIHLLDALGTPDVALESLMTGSLDLYSGSLEYYGPIVGPEIDILSLPFLIPSHDVLRAYLKSETFQPALDKLLQNGIRVISTEWNGDKGPTRVLMANRPVNSIDELAGLKLRVLPNDIYRRAWDALGAVAIQLPWTETYLAIRQGTVDSVTTPLSLVGSTRFAEVAPHIIDVREFPQTWPITISERTWQSLSEQHRQILVDSANDAGIEYARVTVENAERELEMVKKENGATFTPIDREAWAAKIQPFYEKLVSDGVFSAELIAAIKELGN